MSDRQQTRPALLAGQWYPHDAEGCQAAIVAHTAIDAPSTSHCGLVAPHAGWSYSGAAAIKGYARLAASNTHVDLVVLFGAHRSPSGPNTVFCGAAWDTPLGAVSGAQELANTLAHTLELDDEPVMPSRIDNAAELHLPFIRYFFPKAELLMLGVATSEISLSIGKNVGRLVHGANRRAVFIGSTDLTHYGPNYDNSPKGIGRAAVDWTRDENDRGFIDCVLANDSARALRHAREQASACCPGAVAATMAALAAYEHALTPALVDHYLSYDISANTSFVGYASILL